MWLTESETYLLSCAVRFSPTPRVMRNTSPGKIHPSAKIKLFGLRMQALHGDAPAKDDADAEATIASVRGLKGSLLALHQLKVNAWRSEKGKGQKEAMLEYVKVVTSISPQWSVAAILGGHESMKDKKPKRMVWVLRVQLEEVDAEEVEKRLSVLRSRKAKSSGNLPLISKGSRFRATSIEILQSSGDSTARLLAEERIASKGETNGLSAGAKSKSGDGEEENDGKELDPFVAAMPKDLTLEDCIIDKAKHKTIEEQRAYYSKKMRDMAQTLDGWEFYGKTNISAKFQRQLDIHSRSVTWSSAKQLRSEAETKLDVISLFKDMKDGVGLQAAKTVAGKKYLASQSKTARRAVNTSVRFIFLKKDDDSVTALQYRVIPFPWPLASRDAFGLTEGCFGGKRDTQASTQWFSLYYLSFDSLLCPPREGHVRAKTKFHGFVGMPRTKEVGGTRLTFFFCIEWGFKFSLASALTSVVEAASMTYPLAKVLGAEKRCGLLQKDRDQDQLQDAKMNQHFDATKDSFVANMPKDLTIQDCLIDKEKFPTIDAQRTYFRERMLAMARHGHDEEDGWTFASKTQMKGLPAEQQLDVYEREVKWSKVKQLRSVVETEFTCDEVFDHLLATVQGPIMHEVFREGLTKDQMAAFSSSEVYPFVSIAEDSVIVVLWKEIPFPWPLTPRYTFIVQDYIRTFDNAGKPLFLCYNHDVEHPYFSSRESYVRSRLRYQGLVGVPLAGKGAGLGQTAARLTWLVNMEFGGLVPTMFVREGLLKLMFFPRTHLIAMEQVWSESDAKSLRGETRSLAGGKERGKEQGQGKGGKDPFITDMPQNLSTRDCLVAEFKGKNLDEQRAYFVKMLKEMAREGHEKEDGWKYRGKTNARGVEVEDQLDVYEREVAWSAVKQVRTVVETSDFSCDDMFDFLLDDYGTTLKKFGTKYIEGSDTEAVISGRECIPFALKTDENHLVGLRYQHFPFPWPFTPRYYFIVQDYSRLRGQDGRSSFVCYNHDVEHEYFAQRGGFQKMSIKFQGLIGVARGPRSSDDGERRSITRLTWLMNMDFQGLVPAFVVQSAILTTSSYPRLKLLELEKWTRGKKEADFAATVAKLRDELRKRDAELARGEKEVGLVDTVAKLRKELRDKEDELKRSKESAAVQLRETEADREQKMVEAERFILNMPRDLSARDCLVAEFKDKNLDQQRSYFVEKLKEMAREGHDKEDGWKYKGKTNARNVNLRDQLDVYEREVAWSVVKQVRTVVETAEFSCDEVFSFLLGQFGRNSTFESHATSAHDQKALAGGEAVFPFLIKNEDSALGLKYHEVPLPWPFTPRYYLIVQDYRRLQAKEDGSSWFVCYNHDVEHDYFDKRAGFKKMSIKFQGMVGAPRRHEVTSNAAGKGCRLTWLMNVDFQGLVPTWAVQHVLLTTAAFPRVKLLQLEEQTSGKKEAELARLREKLRGKDELLRGKDELLRGKDELLRGKDAELKAQKEREASKVAALTEEVSTLRRRLATFNADDV